MKNYNANPPHIFVISHERSGTHIAIDSIRNNFPIYRKSFYLNIDRMVSGHWNQCSPNVIENELSDKPRIIKTHTIRDIDGFFASTAGASQLVNKYLKRGKIIYVYRNGIDVMGSLYTFWRRTIPDFDKVSFSEMLKGEINSDIGIARNECNNPIDYWRDHVQNWIETPDIHLVSYEYFQSNYENVVKGIGIYLQMTPTSPIKSVLRKGTGGDTNKWFDKIIKFYLRHLKKLDSTSVLLNKGDVAGHKDIYSNDDLAYFAEKAKPLMDKLGYSL